MQYSQLFAIFLLSWKITAGTDSHKFTRKYLQESIPCKNDDECQIIIERSECADICICPKETLLSSDASKCLGKVKGFGDECEDNVQCSENLSTGGVCVNNKCKCKEGFHYLKGKCWKNANLNARCLKNEQCFSDHEYVGLECDKEKCKCRSQYYERLGSGCRRNMSLNEGCNLDTDCPKETTCDNMVCSRNERRVDLIEYNEETHALSGNVELGSDCKNNTDCKDITNAVCLDNRICACKPPKFVASEDNKRCLQSTRGKVEDIRKSNCRENAQCAVFGGNSICEDKRCACKNGTYWEVKNQFCWTIGYVGEKCKVNEDCYPSGIFATCKGQVCECQEGYHQKGAICVRDARKVGDHCEEDAECLFPYSYCNDSNACACQENYYSQNGVCLGGVKSACETDSDCYHLNNTKCRSSNSSSPQQCLCLDDYVSSDENNYCLPVVKLGGKCEKSFQCRTDLGKFGECEGGVCGCKNKTHYFYGKCYLSKYVKESCTRLQDCHPGSDTNSVVCRKGFCSCNYGYQPDKLGLCLQSNSTGAMKPYLYGVLAALFLLSYSVKEDGS